MSDSGDSPKTQPKSHQKSKISNFFAAKHHRRLLRKDEPANHTAQFHPMTLILPSYSRYLRP